HQKVSGFEEGGLAALSISIGTILVSAIPDPVTAVAPFGIQQPPNPAAQYNYGRGTTAGRGFQARGRGGRGRGAFGSNFIPLGGQ
ncbi:MAG: hypothetical protein EZS28_053755, partial [Streblomastix strix]